MPNFKYAWKLSFFCSYYLGSGPREEQGRTFSRDGITQAVAMRSTWNLAPGLVLSISNTVPSFRSIAWKLSFFCSYYLFGFDRKSALPKFCKSAMSVVVIGSSKLSPLRVGGINSYKMRGQTWKLLENWVFFVHTVWSHVGLFTWEIWSRSLDKRAYIKK